MPRIWRFGDDVNTDVIIPARYNITTDPIELAKYCFCEDRPDFAKEAKPGDIIVAGSNFGCGSSREHAPIAIKACGIAAIIAPSYARIFHRNAMNIGLAAVESTEDLTEIEDGMEATFSIEAGILQVGGRTFTTTPLPHVMIQLIQAGGLTSFVKNQNIEELLAS